MATSGRTTIVIGGHRIDTLRLSPVVARARLEAAVQGVAAEWVAVLPLVPGPDEAAVVARLMDAIGDADAAAVARPSTDALKEVEDGWVVGTVDRADVVELDHPYLVHTEVLAGLAAGSDQPDIDVLVELVRRGHIVRAAIIRPGGSASSPTG